MPTRELHPAFAHVPIALRLNGDAPDPYGWRKQREDSVRVAFGLMGLLRWMRGKSLADPQSFLSAVPSVGRLLRWFRFDLAILWPEVPESHFTTTAHCSQ